MAKVLLLGSTGLVGGHLLKKLLDDPFFEEVTVWVRTDPGVTHPRLKVVVTDFNTLPESSADIVFSCLGTTRKKTPDAEVYYFIEVGIPINTAKNLLNNGLHQFHYISSIGAKEKSIGTYLQNKWAAESGLTSLEIPVLYLYRPSLISGKRKELRILENISNALFSLINPLLTGSMKKYRRIEAEIIAESMVRNSKSAQAGVHILESDRIHETAS